MIKKKWMELWNRWRPPLPGQRIIKTTVAVFLCLLIYYLRGYHGEGTPTESCITAIICMQPYVSDTRQYALNRLAGTVIGAVCGLLFLGILYRFPSLAKSPVLLYGVMALGMMLALYTTVLLHKQDASSLAAIVFIWIVIAFPDIEDPHLRAATRVLDLTIGMVVAVLVNIFRLPHVKNRDYLFFVRARDLVPDRFSHLSSAALFRLNYLFHDGARICLISEHAPAFFTFHMSAAKLNVPLIVMDGAAIYDLEENHYRYVENVQEAASDWLKDKLDAMGISHFIYTVHKNKTCIFHRGAVTEEEKKVFDRMKQSPYREYLEGEIYESKEIVYFKIIDKDEQVFELQQHLSEFFLVKGLRSAIRPQNGVPGVSALYVYSADASVEKAKEKLIDILGKETRGLKPRDVFSLTGYRTEHDAIQVLHTLGNLYEPIGFTCRGKVYKIGG